MKARKLTSRIHCNGQRGKPLAGQAQAKQPGQINRVGPIFGAKVNDMGGVLVRTIGLVRAKAKIGTQNIVYNMRRLGQLSRLNPSPA